MHSSTSGIQPPSFDAQILRNFHLNMLCDPLNHKYLISHRLNFVLLCNYFPDSISFLVSIHIFETSKH
jgi:hypothetical protein